MKPVKDGIYWVRFNYKTLVLGDDYEQGLFYKDSWYIVSDRIDSSTIQVIEWWDLPKAGTGNSAI